MQTASSPAALLPYAALSYFPPAAYRVLLSGGAEQVYLYLTSKDTPVPDGADALRWLRAHRPRTANEVLCVLYGITCQQTPPEFTDSEFERAHAKWVVSAEAGSGFSRDVPAIPPSASLAVAPALAVRAFRLDELFLEPSPAL
jgi:hypothetical protein